MRKVIESMAIQQQSNPTTIVTGVMRCASVLLVFDQDKKPHFLILMKLKKFLLLACATITIGCALPAAEPYVPMIPMEDFFRNPERAGFQLSPDGRHLSFLAPWQNRLNIHVQELGSDEVRRVTSSTDRDITSYGWANDHQLVFIQDREGDENYHLFILGIEGGETRNLTPFEGVRVQIIDALIDIPGEMIIAMNRRDARVFDPFRLDLDSGEMVQLAENPGNITGWMTDNAGKLRIAMVTDGINSSVLYRTTEEDPFRTIISTDFRTSVSPLFFTFDNKRLYATSNLNRDLAAIVILDPETGEEREEIFAHPVVDVTNLMRSRHREVITGVSYNVDKVSFHFFDAQREELQRRLERELTGVEVRVSGSSRDESRFLVRTFSDRSLGDFYLYDVAKDELTHLAAVSPWLNPDYLAAMKPIQYTSRDGLTIRGYLTLPRVKEPTQLPVVVLAHGGPWARDSWGFHPEVQFFANRGYAVLQVNFRGSTGFGRAFWEASFREWGRSMQDDVTDGVKWLIEKGVADPARIAIYGGSYGGYKALAGLTFTPELYAAGVSFVGPSNIFTLLESFPPYWQPLLDMMHEMVGHPERDEELLRAASPLFHIENIRAPLFIAQGANDPRVVQRESDQIVEALRARGIEVPYMLKANEGHGFANEENRFAFYRAMDAFLAEHIGGRSESDISILDELK